MPRRSSGAYRLASSRTLAIAASASASAFVAGSFWPAQPTMIMAIASQIALITTARVDKGMDLTMEISSRKSGNQQLLPRLDLVRVVQHFAIGVEDPVVQHLVAVELLGDFRERVAAL